MTGSALALAQISEPPEERRADPRVRTIYRAGTIRTDREDGPCRFHNISDGGALIETNMSVETGSRIQVEFLPDQSLAAEVIWQRSGMVGLRFLRKIDCCSIIRSIARGALNGK